MNGLKYIRTRCNLSLSELAETMGITRQALSAWENGKKEIPEQRKEQLAHFFGIDKAYFGEISEEEKRYLLEKAMFRYDDNGKETYRYKPKDGTTNLYSIPICFMGERTISLDEEYVLAQKKKQEMLENIDDIIKWTSNAGSIESQMVCINRGCSVYALINEMMEEMRGMQSYMRMPFFYEMMNVWKAMMIAYGLKEKEDVTFLDRSGYYCGEDGEWILELSKMIEKHWDQEREFHQKNHEKNMEEAKRRREERKNNPPIVKSIEEQIADAEEQNREFMKEHPEIPDKGLTVFGK